MVEKRSGFTVAAHLVLILGVVVILSLIHI